MRKTTKLMAVALVGASLLSLAPAASASDGGVIRRGSCSAQSTWKLKAKPDSGRIELEFEVDQNVVGQRWRVTIRRNGAPIFSGVRITQAPSGSFDVQLRPANSAGADRFVARATNRSTGETCVGALTLRR